MSQSLALTFNGVTLSPISHKNQTWLSTKELSAALGYARADSINKIFERNKDEFTGSMSVILPATYLRQTDVTTDSSGVQTEQRLFSLRGCHLIAMFAKTVIAKQFRVWVLDVLDKEVGEPKRNGLIELESVNKTQWGILSSMVANIAISSGKEGTTKSGLWSRFNTHFKIGGYKELPAIKFDDAVTYLDAKRDDYDKGFTLAVVKKDDLMALGYDVATKMFAVQALESPKNTLPDNFVMISEARFFELKNRDYKLDFDDFKAIVEKNGGMVLVKSQVERVKDVFKA